MTVIGILTDGSDTRRDDHLSPQSIAEVKYQLLYPISDLLIVQTGVSIPRESGPLSVGMGA